MQIGCAGQGIASGMAVVGFIASKLSAYDALVNGASSLGVGVAVTGVILGGFGAGWAIGSWISCVQAS